MVLDIKGRSSENKALDKQRCGLLVLEDLPEADSMANQNFKILNLRPPWQQSRRPERSKRRS